MERDGNEGDGLDRSVDKALINAKKALKSEEDSKVVSSSIFKSSYDASLISLFAIAEKQP